MRLPSAGVSGAAAEFGPGGVHSQSLEGSSEAVTEGGKFAGALVWSPIAHAAQPVLSCKHLGLMDTYAAYCPAPTSSANDHVGDPPHAASNDDSSTITPPCPALPAGDQHPRHTVYPGAGPGQEERLAAEEAAAEEGGGEEGERAPAIGALSRAASGIDATPGGTA